MAPMVDEDVRWTNFVNVTLAGNALRKTGGADNGFYDGNAVSQQTITSNGYYEFKATGANVERVTGLTDTPANTAFDTFDFYVNLSEGGFAEFRERGVYLGDVAYNAGDTFRITLVNGRAEFSHNGVFRVRSATATNTVMYASASFSLLGGEISAARMGNISGGGCAVNPSQTSVNVAAAATVVGIDINIGAGCPWTIVSNAAWLTVNGPSSFVGSGVGGVAVAANTGAARTGTVTIAGFTFTINQAAGTPTCVPPAVNIGPGVLRICEQASWNFTATVTSGTGPFSYQWFKDGVAISGATGTSYGSASASFAQAGNYSVQVRNACGTATSTNAPGNLVVAGLTSLNPTSAGVPASGGTGTISINTGANSLDTSCGYVYTVNDTWITARRDDTGGSGRLIYTVTANSGAARTGTITVRNASGTRSLTFTINQAAATVTCTYSINPTSANVGAGGGNGTVTVNTSAGCAWSASPAAGWLQVTSSGSGIGTGTFTYLAAPNSGAARSGVITVNGQNFTVSQAGTTTGGNVQDVIWTSLVNTTATGGTIRKTGGRNDGTYDGSGVSTQSFSNNGYYEFTVGGADVERQTGLTDTPSNLSFTTWDFYVNLSEGPVAEFKERGVYLGEVRYKIGDVFRITVENGRARYSHNVNIILTGNATTGGALKAVAAFSLLNGEVTQAKLGGLTGGCSYAIAPTNASAPASGATGTVAVTAPGGCAWTATSNATWLSVTSGAAGNGNGTVAYAAGANTGAQRTGTLTIAGQTFTVTQAAAAQSSPDVTWTQLNNVSLIGATLRKTGGANDGTYDGSAVSREALT
ncbi:MAG: BACON domain-containing protein, partial [Acidobacteria bacterium]|nr:BACON domain-containing protein [Acidobacteriota bacterium]